MFASWDVGTVFDCTCGLIVKVLSSHDGIIQVIIRVGLPKSEEIDYRFNKNASVIFLEGRRVLYFFCHHDQHWFLLKSRLG